MLTRGEPWYSKWTCVSYRAGAITESSTAPFESSSIVAVRQLIFDKPLEALVGTAI